VIVGLGVGLRVKLGVKVKVAVLGMEGVVVIRGTGAVILFKLL